ncbi:MAG TPA: M20/M25/M40 family metallo-hydrolase [Opitutaceae bacterium]|nr:M20/M25/M40 family metallo-hydrolase [Opitutaceae bacterium]
MRPKVPGLLPAGRAGCRLACLAAAVAALGPGARGAGEPELTRELRAHVTMLAETIGPRALGHGDSLRRAADYVAGELARDGWTVRRLPYEVRGVVCENIEVERRGARQPDEIIVIGAHYDSIVSTPGADDNASGVAALLALAKRFRAEGREPDRTLRFVAFPNEEPMYFQTRFMGSRVYARACRERGDRIVGMLSLESIGYYSSRRGTQHYPSIWIALFRPSRGNFLAFVGNKSSAPLLDQATQAFGESGKLPLQRAALPDGVQGVGWSDHWSFWQEGYPAIMATDTATFRNPHYHQPTDKPDTLDYASFTAAVEGLEAVVAALVTQTP